MTYERLAYDDQDSANQMHIDCAACASSMTLPRERIDTTALTSGPRPLTFEGYPREVRKPEITVSRAAAHLASRMHLHLD